MIYDLQKASLFKRISAFILDAILLCVLATGFALVLSAVLGYDSYNQTIVDCREKYEQEYGVSLIYDAETYDAFSEAEKKAFEDGNAALDADKDYRYASNMLISLLLVMLSMSPLLSYLVLEFAVPMRLGNGQTIGKKIFGIAVMRVDGVKVNGPCMFIRTLLGKYTIETMIPLLMLFMMFGSLIGIVAPIIIALILLLDIVLMIATRTNSAIHDCLANTVAVDIYSQMIFESEAEMIAYKQRLHAEQVEKERY